MVVDGELVDLDDVLMFERFADDGLLLQVVEMLPVLAKIGQQDLDRQPPLVAVVDDGPDLAGLPRLDDVQQPVGTDVFLTCQCHGVRLLLNRRAHARREDNDVSVAAMPPCPALISWSSWPLTKTNARDGQNQFSRL